jgi:hypothetical protein
MNRVRYAIAAPELTGKAAADDHTEDHRSRERAIGLLILLGRDGVAQQALACVCAFRPGV